VYQVGSKQTLRKSAVGCGRSVKRTSDRSVLKLMKEQIKFTDNRYGSRQYDHIENYEVTNTLV
jgi:uncharacterized protein (DUF169 family)